jgi:hypothetical protein
MASRALRFLPRALEGGMLSRFAISHFRLLTFVRRRYVSFAFQFISTDFAVDFFTILLESKICPGAP